MFSDGSPDLQSLLEQATALQQQLMAAQNELADRRVDGTAGGGLVQATVTGTGELVGLTIDPKACDPGDTETLSDLVIAAVHDAAANAQREAAEQIGDVTGDLGAQLPGLGQLGF
jgi:DNA-binding YbaB/EbfC family protein